MVKIKLYGLDGSPPVRATKLTLAALNLPYEYVQVNILTKENHSKDYMEKNPLGTIPTLEDDGNYIVDSHAIMAYLVRQYGKNDDLYPKDFLKRALVDQRLHFETGVTFHDALRSTIRPLLYENNTIIPRKQINLMSEVYRLMEVFLVQHPFVAGDKMTIADFSLISSITTLFGILELDTKTFPELAAWVHRLETLPYYEECNAIGAKALCDMIKSTNFTISD